MIGPTAVGYMIAGGLQSVFLMFAVVAAIAAVITALFAVETKGRGAGGSFALSCARHETILQQLPRIAMPTSNYPCGITGSSRYDSYSPPA